MIMTLRSARPSIRSVCRMEIERGDYQTCSIASARARVRASSGSSGVVPLDVGSGVEDIESVGGSGEIQMVTGSGPSSES